MRRVSSRYERSVCLLELREAIYSPTRESSSYARVKLISGHVLFLHLIVGENRFTFYSVLISLNLCWETTELFLRFFFFCLNNHLMLHFLKKFYCWVEARGRAGWGSRVRLGFTVRVTDDDGLIGRMSPTLGSRGLTSLDSLPQSDSKYGTNSTEGLEGVVLAWDQCHFLFPVKTLVLLYTSSSTASALSLAAPFYF